MKMRPMSNTRIENTLTSMMPFSFADRPRIREWMDLFILAHQAAPKGLTIEIGTWRGGTTFAFLEMLEDLYHAQDRPMVFSIDPYGDKPYDGGDYDEKVALFGASDYVAMRSLLAQYPNHAHWNIASEEFICTLMGKRYWWQGEHKTVGRLAFVLIDGQHDAASIMLEVKGVVPHMAGGGKLVIDNTNNDPEPSPKSSGTSPVSAGPSGSSHTKASLWRDNDGSK